MKGLVFSTRAAEHALGVAIAAGMTARGAKFIARVAGWDTCFASMATLTLGRGNMEPICSPRSGFRYQLEARELGLMQSQPGDRHNPPETASVPYALLQHGYAIRRVIGDLGDACRDIGRSAWESVQRKKSQNAAKWAARKGRERAAREAEHREWQAKHPYPARPAVGDLLGQAVAKAAMPKREPVRRSITAEQLDAELAAIPWDTVSPGKPPPE